MERHLGADLPAGPRPGVTGGLAGGHLPSLALYVHTPWCVRKCPYCDFNSHGAGPQPPFDPYVERLLADLDEELSSPAARRPITSIFIGGGTPSLFPGASIASLLAGVRARARLAPDCEVTLEANPGAADAERFADYRRGGVNRLSIGVQSLSADQLQRLGRIHDPAAARAAVGAARAAGFDNLNLDLMFGLPGQTLEQARDDLEALIALAPEHISYYQLTLEPNTAFYAAPPDLPDPDLVADMTVQGRELLADAGYCQYEVSAFARPGLRCRHNLNYWRFGDYLGIGAGAHGKLTDHGGGGVRRRAKLRHPGAYLQAPPGGWISRDWMLDPPDLVFEFALNAFRLTDGFETSLFMEATGLPWSHLRGPLLAAQGDGLIQVQAGRVVPTALGRDFLDTLISRFLPS
jgi:putative oxygen-independent coproporphyrinogen III oxidase